MTIEYLSLPDRTLAYQREVGNPDAPGVLFLCGFGTNMTGTKASFLSEQCRKHNLSFLRFDYRGCGKSSGDFEKGTIGAWLDDAFAAYDRLTKGPQIVVASSMGGWLGLMLAEARPERTKAFVGVAAAPDCTEDLLWDQLNDAQRAEVVKTGAFRHGDDPPFSLTIIEEARKHLILRRPVKLRCPVRLLQGTDDAEVPFKHAERIAQHIGGDVRVIPIEGGDHHLSTHKQMMVLWRTIMEFLK